MNRCNKLPLALGLFLLAACAAPSPPPTSGQARADAATAAACRQRADAVYNERHRDTLYAPPRRREHAVFRRVMPRVSAGSRPFQVFERDAW